MNTIDKSKLIGNMADNLPMLRTRLGMTQEELAERIGVSRSTVLSIENKKRDMTWNTFLSLMYLFTNHEVTDKLLRVLDINTTEINRYMHGHR